MWKEAQKHLSEDRYIGPLIKKYGDCTIKPKHHRDYFEDLCGAIIGQQLSGRVADVIFKRFEVCVRRVKPQNILGTTDQKLRDCGMSWAKVSFIKNLAEKTQTGELKTKKLAKLSDEEVEKELVAIKGIGKWTAQMFLIFTLGRPDVFPIDDLGIKNGMKKIIKKEMTKGQMINFAERWKPYRSIASWYIWRNLDSK